MSVGIQDLNQKHERVKNSEFKLQNKRVRGSQPFSTPLLYESKNENDRMFSPSEKEPRKKRKLKNAPLPDRTVTSPGKASTFTGNPGADVDQFSGRLFAHQDGLDDDHSSSAFANTNPWLHLSVSPKERSKKRRVEPKKQRATLDDQLSLADWKKAVLSWNNNGGR